MRKMVFVDESGNPGFKNEQGEFVMAAIVVLKEGEYTKIDSYMSDFKRSLHWSEDAEFKFVKTKKDILQQMLIGLLQYDFEVYCLVMRKSKILKIEGGCSIYDYMLAQLINKIHHPNLCLLVDGKYGRKHQQKIRTYLRSVLKTPLCNFKYGNSKSYNGLQLADIIVGIIHRFCTGKKDYDILFSLIERKIKVMEELK